MGKRDLVRVLRSAAQAMPAGERRKFAQLLRGRPSVSVPGDHLPPMTLDRDAAPERRRRARPETPDQFRQLGLL